MNDLESKSSTALADDTVVHPGHGDDTRLGTERRHLGEGAPEAGDASIHRAVPTRRTRQAVRIRRITVSAGLAELARSP